MDAIIDKGAMVQALVDKYTKGNKAQFANLLGVSAQTISAWITRKTFDAELIYAKCSYVSAVWLLTGRGDMLRNERHRQAQEPTIIYKSDPKDAAMIADKQLIIERDAELIASLRDKIKELEAKLTSMSVGLHSAPAVDIPSVGGNQTSLK